MKNLIQKNKNKLKRKYKNAVEQEYLDIYNKKRLTIDDKGKLLLFICIRKLRCQFRISDHSLGIEREQYYKIPRHLRHVCEKCGVVDVQLMTD